MSAAEGTPCASAAAEGSPDTILFLARARAGALQLSSAISSVYGPLSEKEIVQLLRDGGLDVNARGPKGMPPLTFATLEHNGLDVCRILLGCGADVNARCSRGLTALHLAILEGNEQICRLLVASGADLGAVAFNGGPEPAGYVGFLSPLAVAVTAGRADMCTLLLEAGARPDSQCFIRSVAHRNLQILRALVHAADNLPEEQRNPLLESALFEAVKQGQEGACRLLLTEGRVRPIQLNERFDTPLLVATAKGYVGVCKAILDAGVKPDAYCDNAFTPLHVVTTTEHYDVCELFLQQPGVNVDVATADAQRATPLLEAVGTGNTEMVKLFIKYGANVNARSALFGWTPLYRAASRGRDEAVRVLLEAGASVTERATDGDAPIHAAARGGHVEVCKILLRTGLVSVHDRGEGGKTPLHRAANSGLVTAVRVLIEAKADINARCDKGRTPLHVASESGRHETCRLLITAGASVSERDNAGYQPLHLAAGASYWPTCNLLIENGADTRAKTSQGGFTPMHLAARYPYSVTAAFAQLLEAGGPAVLEDLDGKGYNCLQFAVKSGNAQGARCLLNAGARFPAAVLDGSGAGAAACVDSEDAVACERADAALGLTGPASSLHEKWDRMLARVLHRELAELLGGCSWLLAPEERRFLRWAASLPQDVLDGAFRMRHELYALPAYISDPTWPEQRERMVAALKDDGWERRKHLVTWYFEERRRRREGARDDGKKPDAPTASNS